jgi:hypothetical protein
LKIYDLYRENRDHKELALLSNPSLTFQSGQPSTNFASFDPLTNSIAIKSSNETLVGVIPLLLRECINDHALTEVNLYVNVLANTYPDFVVEPQTIFTVAVNETYKYDLPEVRDPEGNDESEIYV